MRYVQQQIDGKVTYTLPAQGKVHGQSIVATLDPASKLGNVDFVVGDACKRPSL
jgi:hypothetical protein